MLLELSQRLRRELLDRVACRLAMYEMIPSS